MARNIGNVISSINDLVSELGLEKLAEDPGTSHPAKQEAGKANIQTATEGARSAENTADNKAEVTGQSIAEGKPGDAKKDKAESSAKNLTTASFVGEDPKVERAYVSNSTDPGTTHPAKADEKTAEDLAKCAEAVLAEIKNIKEASVATPAEAREKLAALLEKPEQVDSAVTEYLQGYTKSAALVGELTADLLDGMAIGMAEAAKEKKAAEEEGGEAPAGEESEAPAEEAAPEAAPAGGGAGAGAGGVDEEAAALAQAAVEIAKELGVSPEDVLNAAEAELGQAEGGAGGPPAGGMPPGMGGMEATAAVKEAQAKAAKYDELMKKQAEDEATQKQAAIVTTAVGSALEQYMAKHKETK